MKHLAIIMDGNRRWATAKWLDPSDGHKAGARNVVKIAKLVQERDIEFLTLWWLSTDNLTKRSATEVAQLIKIITNAKAYLQEILDNNAKIELIGDIEKLPKVSKIALNHLVEETKENTGLTIVLALIYGWQNEIVRGFKKFAESWWNIEELSESNFLKYLDTGKYPPADMIVRTGWDIRHSWFMLYQSDYSEYHFTDTKWPDFWEDDLNLALEQFSKSKRNFWK